MQKRIKLQKTLIFILAVLISILLVGLLAGRNDVTTVLVVTGEKLDPNKYLTDQINLIGEIQISKDELEKFNGRIVTHYSQLKGKKLNFTIQRGSPILLDALTTTKTAGQFASETPIYHTIYKLKEAVSSLPPGVQPGDRIDVNFVADKKDKKGGNLFAGALLKNIKIQGINGQDVYLMVTKQQFNELSLSSKIGSFVLQLPGQKDVETCSVAIDKLDDELQEELNNVYKSDIEADKIPEVIEKTKEKYEIKREYVECYELDYKTKTITEQDIFEKVFNSQTSQDIIDKINNKKDEFIEDNSDEDYNPDDVLDEIFGEDNNNKEEEPDNSEETNDNKKNDQQKENNDSENEDYDFYN